MTSTVLEENVQQKIKQRHLEDATHSVRTKHGGVNEVVSETDIIAVVKVTLYHHGRRDGGGGGCDVVVVVAILLCVLFTNILE